jgi:hypothetical protein
MTALPPLQCAGRGENVPKKSDRHGWCGGALECGGSTPLSFLFPSAAVAGGKKERKESGVKPPHSKEPKRHRAAP